MHDLALALGTPVGTLARFMTEAELGRWRRYAARRMLPQRRIELYLAQIALLIVKVVGGNSTSVLEDFLFDPIEEDADDSAEAEAKFFDFKPRKPRATPEQD